MHCIVLVAALLQITEMENGKMAGLAQQEKTFREQACPDCKQAEHVHLKLKVLKPTLASCTVCCHWAHNQHVHVKKPESYLCMPSYLSAATHIFKKIILQCTPASWLTRLVALAGSWKDPGQNDIFASNNSHVHKTLTHKRVPVISRPDQTRLNVGNAKFVPFWNVTDGMQHFAVLFLVAVVDLSLAGQEMRIY